MGGEWPNTHNLSVPRFGEVGGLMAYSIDQADIYRRLANLIDKILGGANAGDIPFISGQIRAGHQSQDRESPRP
jgi:hypothetical protein